MNTGKHTDKETVISAKGLLKKLTELDTVAALHIVDFVFNIMSPVTVCLQGIAVDGSVQGFIDK